MTTIPETPAITPANKYTPDAQEWMTRIRAMATEFPDEADPKPLTQAEIVLARSTTVAALENAAVLVEAAPAVAGAIAIATPDAVEMRDAIAFELAYGSVREEARALVRRIDHAILRRKLKAARNARELYRVAKSFVTVNAGDAVRPHVAEMKRALRVGRRRTSTAAPATPSTAKQ